jgi:hypothetical protein
VESAVKVRDLDDWKVYECSDLFLNTPERPSPTKVAAILSKAWGIPGREQEDAVKHTDVYPILSEALRRGFVRLVAPPAIKWTEALARRFRLPRESIHVVAARGSSALPAVSGAAADHIVELIQKLGASKSCVHIALVGGRTVMAVARDLAARLRHADRLPKKLVVHAACSGFDAMKPESAPNSFFGYFTDLPTEVGFVGLFTNPIVDAKDYELVRNMRGVVESFRIAEEIDVVITSLGSAADRHGPLRDLQDVSEQDLGDLRAAEVVGDVSYCPFSADGPVLLDSGPRAVTLFQIADLVRLAARKDKHVVLIASACPAPDCGRLRADALEPLFVNPSLKAWSSVFLDEETAEKVVGASKVPAPGDSEDEGD